MYSSNRTIIADSSAIVNFIPFTNERCFVGSRAKGAGHSRNTATSYVFFFCPFFGGGKAPIELGDAYFEQCHFGVLDGVHVKYGLEGDLRWIVSALASS